MSSSKPTSFPSGGPETVLVAIDVNEAPERREALERHAKEIAEEHDARLIALHVIEPPSPLASLGGFVMAPQAQANEDFLRRRTHDAKETLRDELPGIEVYAPVGRPAPRIVRTARSLREPWIVIGSDDHNALTRTLFGSVTDTVVREAPCPVHVVPLPRAS